MTRTAEGSRWGWFALAAAILVIGVVCAWLVLSSQPRETQSANFRWVRPLPLERPQIPDLPIDVPGG